MENSSAAILDNVLLADGRHTRIRLDGATIVAIDDATTPALPHVGTPRLDLGGALLLPGLFDGHLHLDKTLIGLPWMPHAAEPTRMSRIETDHKTFPFLTLSTEQRAINLIRRCAGNGSAHLRSHVDIDTVAQLKNLEGVLAARERCKAYADVQLVAFPQSGVMRRHGTLELLDAAIGMGADLVGGIDPGEIDRDPRGQLDGIFAIADKRGVGLDIHLHEPGELGLFNVQEICARTKALGLAGKVTVSHGFCLGDVIESKARQAAELMGKCGVMLVTHGAAGWSLPPITVLREHGVTVFAGNDDVRDTWSPYGTGDVLERAALIGWRADFRRDDQMKIAYEMITSEAAKAFGVQDHDIRVGAKANFFSIEASSMPEALAGYPRRKLVFHNGCVVARDGVALDAPLTIAEVAR